MGMPCPDVVQKEIPLLDVECWGGGAEAFSLGRLVKREMVSFVTIGHRIRVVIVIVTSPYFTVIYFKVIINVDEQGSLI